MNIRPIAIAILEDEGCIFVGEGYDRVKQEWFYRPLGGGIEFGETGAQALVREFREELNAELCDVEYKTTLENIFTCEGVPGHQIVLVYTANFSDHSFLKKSDFLANEDGAPFVAKWINLAEFISGRRILYPHGLAEYF